MVLRALLALGILAAPVALTQSAVSQESPSPPSAIMYAADFQFTASSRTDLNTPGAQTVKLVSCPKGVIGSEKDYWVYISGTGSPEAVRVSGGSCKGDGNAGTLQFTTVNAHPAGYTISSASGGLAEASIAAGYIPRASYPSSGGLIVAPPGNISIYGQLTIRRHSQTVEFPGGVASCYSSTTPCLYVGDSANSNAVLDVTIDGFKGRPRIVNGTQAMIEVNAQRTRLIGIGGMYDPGRGTFGTWVKVNDDEAFLVDGLSTTTGLGTIRCDSAYCGAVIVANGSFNSRPQRAPVGWVKNSNLNLQCGANGIDWQSGNTLRVSDTVIQGHPQFAVRYSNSQGGYGGLQMENVYTEYSPCGPGRGSPSIPNAAAGVIVQNSSSFTNPNASIRGGEGPAGGFPIFATGGSTRYNYYVIGVKANGDRTVPLLLGMASPANGSAAIPVKWYDLPPAQTFDLLRVSGAGDALVPPYGTGNYAVATGLPQAKTCSGGVCSYTDTQAALSSYNIGSIWDGTAARWAPKIDLWPGSVILSPPRASDLNYVNHPVLYADLIGAGAAIISAAGGAFPQIFALHCAHSGPGAFGYNWPVCLGNSSPNQQMKLLAGMQAGGSATLQNLKGVLNMGYNAAANGPTHLITLFDYDIDISRAYGGTRAPNSTRDAFIGIDSNNTNTNVGVSMGAPFSISNYVGNVGDGANWLERLTKKSKIFQVPITSTVSPGTAPLVVASATPVDNLTVSNHPTLHNCGGTATCSHGATTKGQIVYGQVTLSSGAALVAGISPPFAAASSFQCAASDRTTAVNPANAVPRSGTSVEVHGTGKDTISYICVGN